MITAIDILFWLTTETRRFVAVSSASLQLPKALVTRPDPYSTRQSKDPRRVLVVPDPGGERTDDREDRERNEHACLDETFASGQANVEILYELFPCRCQQTGQHDERDHDRAQSPEDVDELLRQLDDRRPR